MNEAPVCTNGAQRTVETGGISLERDQFWLRSQATLRFFCTTFLDFKAFGANNMPAKGGVLLVSNHQSYLDPVLLAWPLRRPISFLAKSELFVNPKFGWIIRRLHAFPLRQGEGDIGALRETVRRLQEGHVLNVYPEGARSRNGEIGPMMPGVGLIARRAGVPVVPAAIHGAFASWPIGQRLPRPHRVRVKYGEPMMLAGRKPAEIVNSIDGAIRGLFDQLRSSDK